MNTNVNLEAALGVFGFVASCALLLAIGLVALHALLTRRSARLKGALAAAFCFVLSYLGLLLVFSFMSSERQLARGEEKYFCEIDCHLAYAVTDVLRTKTLGTQEHQAVAGGVYYVVTVRTRFDEQTTNPERGSASLTPNSRVLTVLDSQGRSYAPSDEGMRALEFSRSGGTALSTPLLPGQSYATTFVFDLPEEAVNPLLLINEAEPVTRFIIGHENSPLHKKVLFRLGEAPKQAATSKLSRRLSWHVKGVISALLRRLIGYDAL